MKGKIKPTVKLESQWTLPPTMKADGREDCRKISVISSAGMGPGGGVGRVGEEEGLPSLEAEQAHKGSRSPCRAGGPRGSVSPGLLGWWQSRVRRPTARTEHHR